MNPVLTIGEQIIETLLRHTSLSRKEAREKSLKLLEQVEIASPKEKLDQYPHQLSGGMRQRAMIAMALSCSPRILIADEPTTALDVLIQAQILDLLKKIKNETQMSILLITHDLGVVAEIAKRVMVMYAGEIVESGPVLDLFRSPLHPYTIGLMKSIPTLKPTQGKLSKLNEISGVVPSLSQIPSGCPFHPRCPSAETRCKTEKPKLKKIANEYSVSCWLH
ncbi:MAG: ABC transporter ATP-binding protein [Nitrospinales bacterium]|jgi:oligopeptide/dipeptide ABC transporter ATP-binding protein|nr:ABC transporter ATP-binding protein [Nitrospinales bacterium]